MAGSGTHETIDLVDDWGMTPDDADAAITAIKAGNAPKSLDDDAKEAAVNAIGFEWGYYLPDGTEED
jgi:hypothetical protein